MVGEADPQRGDPEPPDTAVEMNHVFFTVAGRPFCLLQETAAEHFALVDVAENRIVRAGPWTDLAAAVAGLLTGAN